VKTSELTRQSGVTRRALRLYEQKQLIRPPRSVDNGYREYDRETVERVHTIRLLQTIGFSLAEVRQMIGGAKVDWAHTLSVQEEILIRRHTEIGDALRQVRSALARLRAGGPAKEVAAVIDLIAARATNEDYKAMRETVSKYYNEKAREKLANHPATPEEIKLGERAWASIIEEIEGMIRDKKDPGSSQAKALVKRMDALIGAFTLGDPDVEEGLNKLYADRANWPKDPGPVANFKAEVWDYVGRMRTAAGK
jgi:DNA-binding transcriptional MerR regulator